MSVDIHGLAAVGDSSVQMATSERFDLAFPRSMVWVDSGNSLDIGITEGGMQHFMYFPGNFALQQLMHLSGGGN